MLRHGKLSYLRNPRLPRQKIYSEAQRGWVKWSPPQGEEGGAKSASFKAFPLNCKISHCEVSLYSRGPRTIMQDPAC